MAREYNCGMKYFVMTVGPQASGKTTYCRERLANYCRISQDEQGKEGHRVAFREAIERDEPFIVLDRMNHSREQRGNYLSLARKHGYRTKIVWVNADRNLCIKRAKARKNHPTLAPEKAEEAISWFFKSFQVPSRKEADELEIVGQPPVFVPVMDVTNEIGDRRHIIVGDVHGCFDELMELLAERDFDPKEDVLISVGDLVDRGPKVKEVLDFCMLLPRFYSVAGNHDDKCMRYFEGRNVKVGHGMETTIEAFGGKMPPAHMEFLRRLPLILKAPSGYVVHAGFDPLMLPEEQQRSDCLYMRYYGGKSYFDSFGGELWYKLWPKDYPRVFYGHIPDVSGPCLPNIVSLDGGCVFGDYLKAWDSRDGIVHYLNAKKVYAVSEYQQASETASQAGDAVSKREEYVVAGLLRKDVSDDGKLAVYTYTDQCVFDRAWDPITRNSRGHIFNLETGECVASPFSKFFNLNECDETLYEKFDWSKPYEVYEKVDGWIGILFRHGGKFQVASRGSFHSAGAVWATNFAQGIDFSCLPDEATLCFEIITPDQRIILDYGGQKTLMLLAAFNRRSGQEYPRETVEEWGKKVGLPVVKKYDCSIEDCLRLQKESTGKEGFVIRFQDGRRVKVKTDWYMILAKIMSNLSPIAVWETMSNGKVQDAFMTRIPEELRSLAEEYKRVLETQYAAAKAEMLAKCSEFAAARAFDRKRVALERKILEGTLSYKGVFAVMDKNEKGIDKIVMGAIYPAANQFAATATSLQGEENHAIPTNSQRL
jgi:RNA ligase